MKRTERPFDYAPLIGAVRSLDEALRRGVVIGVYEGSMEVSDEDIAKALVHVNGLLAETARLIDVNARALARTLPLPGAPVLQ